MTQEDKDILIKDLCAKLPYGVKCSHFDDNNAYTLLGIDRDVLYLDCPVYDEGDGYVEIEYCKPYLRSMSSITEEEEIEYDATFDTIYVNGHYDSVMTYKSYDWLNAHHFDYRGLIEKGLAIEAPEGMYN